MISKRENEFDFVKPNKYCMFDPVLLASGHNNAFDVDVSNWVHSCLSLLFHFRPGRQQFNKKCNMKAYKTVRDPTTSDISRSVFDSSDVDGNTSYSINKSRETCNYFDPPLDKF
jgi:hypothetical protein